MTTIPTIPVTSLDVLNSLTCHSSNDDYRVAAIQLKADGVRPETLEHLREEAFARGLAYTLAHDANRADAYIEVALVLTIASVALRERYRSPKEGSVDAATRSKIVALLEGLKNDLLCAGDA